MTVDELDDHGIERMDDEEMRGFLSSQSVGVLGLPAESAPTMRPISFWFDGESELYFLYVLGSESRKERLSDRADAARFLVYSAETRFNWRSVLLTGRIESVHRSELASLEDEIEMRGQPDAFERASESTATALYRFRIDDRTGIKHLGLPPGFERDSVADDAE
jgi:hypothetical protein